MKLLYIRLISLFIIAKSLWAKDFVNNSNLEKREREINEECRFINSILGKDPTSNCCEEKSFGERVTIVCINEHIYTIQVLMMPNLPNNTMPSYFGSMPYLTNLLIFQTDLTGEIPSDFENIPNVYKIALNENNLYGKIPESIGVLENLTMLRLFDNKLTGTIPESFGNLSILSQMDLNDNDLYGPFPTEVFEKMTNLTVFKLYNNENLYGRMPFMNVTSIGSHNYSNTKLCYLESLKPEKFRFSASDLGVTYTCDVCYDDSTEDTTQENPGERENQNQEEKVGENKKRRQENNSGETENPEEDDKLGETESPEDDDKLGETENPEDDVKPTDEEKPNENIERRTVFNPETGICECKEGYYGSGYYRCMTMEEIDEENKQKEEEIRKLKEEQERINRENERKKEEEEEKKRKQIKEDRERKEKEEMEDQNLNNEAFGSFSMMNSILSFAIIGIVVGILQM